MNEKKTSHSDTKARLLEGALQLFASRSYGGVGVNDLAKKGGVTKPSLYHHFGNKAGVLKALLEAHFAPLFRRLDKACEYRGDLPFTLFNVARCLVDFALQCPSFYRLQLALCFAGPESEAHQLVQPYLARRQAILAALFEAVVAHHPNLRGRQEVFAHGFVAMLDAYLAATAAIQQQAPNSLADDEVRLAVKQFMYGIYAL